MALLTHRQLQIIGMLGVRGLTPAGVRAEMGIAQSTYYQELMEARKRTGTKTIEQLIWHVATEVERLAKDVPWK